MRNGKYPFYEVEDLGENTIKALLRKRYEDNKDLIALSYSIKEELISISYENLKLNVDYFGTALYNMRLFNSNIAILGVNSYEWLLSYFAITCSNNTVVPIDSELSKNEILEIIVESRCKAIIYDDTCLDVINYIKNNNINKKIYIEHYIDMKEIEKHILKGKALIEHNVKSYTSCVVSENTVAEIVYTSGTSGKSKGVMLTHKNLISAAIGSSKMLEFKGTSMLVLPLHHTFAMAAGVLVPMIQKKTIYLNLNLKNINKDFLVAKPENISVVPLFLDNMSKKIWSAIEKDNKTSLVKRLIKVSNTLLNIGIDIRHILFKNIRGFFGGNLNVIVCGGAILPKIYISEFRSFGINVINAYGITECSPAVSGNRNNYYKDGSVGQAMPMCKVKIASNNEILVKGDNVMKGYYNNRIETEKAFVDGWFKTGDIGYLDEDSFLYITGRSKNLIILANGRNLSPEEIELDILKIEGVSEAIVYNLHGKVQAEIFPDHDYMKKNNIIDAEKYIKKQIGNLNNKLSTYKRINGVKLRADAFPKTATQKIKRY